MLNAAMVSRASVDHLRQCATKALRATGEFWECGVWRGGSASCLADALALHQPRTLRLFDTFNGRPPKGSYDTGPAATSFTDTSLVFCQKRVRHGFVSWHQGVIPESMKGLEDVVIAFAHVDLDLYVSTVDALTFIRPRLARGGCILVDDYTSRQWHGVRAAVDQVCPDATVSCGRAIITG